MKIIDPHLHLFNLEQGHYQWLKADSPPYWSDKKTIRQSFTEKDLALSVPLQLAGFVHIEAGFDNQQPWREIAWLEDSCSLPFRSIAGVNLLLPTSEFQQILDKLDKFESVVGVRDILDENACAYLSNPQVKENLARLAQQQLTFECQMALTDVVATEQLIAIINELPTLKLVINHAGWPPEDIDSKQWQDWQSGIQALSGYENVAIKCSGFEMVNRQYSASWQQHVIKHCLATFGLDKTMLASNFPLCLFKSSYQKNWITHFENQPLSTTELELLCYKNALRIYQIPI
ncbi:MULTISPECIES: amidohydrolase [unclassified Colwellia]|uniref:amidohydrolase family protein n=1 Tax=unclassified Colwellia TaxID=196834 RepID=UPI0015F4D65C|nr:MULTISPECIES: amidohydrolase family protein [unclassified Colwellia]MBA6381169.1 amidohydrolase family protein [Colwellia sp. BRX10-7]MBA6388833.1 amidohydrolase family protein [Colwellia sp. BRX10-2]MBA6403628.1 amidohydrolase family protein [Colwellia sp. BRX10-5]MBA6407573.1 amidohydrolase family protein [Colwellia sp. BRX10-1]